MFASGGGGNALILPRKIFLIGNLGAKYLRSFYTIAKLLEADKQTGDMNGVQGGSEIVEAT